MTAIARLGDQIAFGLSSILLLWTVARWGGVSEAGSVSLMLIPYAVAASVAQGMFVDRLILSNALPNGEEVQKARRVASTFGLVVGCVTAAIGGLAGFPLWVALFAGVSTGPMLSQYTGRAVKLAAGELLPAIRSDALWLFPQFALASTSLSMPVLASPALAVAAWAAGGTLACLSIGGWALSIPASLKQAGRIVHRDAHLGAELLIAQGAAQLNSVVLLAAGSAALVGAFRLAQSFVSPLLLVAAASRHQIFPLLASHRSDSRFLRRFCVCSLIATVLLGTILALAMRFLLGPVGQLTVGRRVIESVANTGPILAFDVGFSMATIVFSSVLRVTGRVGRAVRIRFLNSAAQLIGIAAGAFLWRTASSAALGLLLADASIIGVWLCAALASAQERPDGTMRRVTEFTSQME